MTEDAPLREQAARGERAERYLDDEVFTGAMARVEARLTASWRDSKAEDRAGREHAYYVLRGLKEVVTEIAKEVDSGRIAQATLNRRATRRS